MFVNLGNLMYLENATVQVQVARSLTKFYSSKSSQTICIGRFILLLNNVDYNFNHPLKQ